MRYDDPERPQSVGADASPLQVSGSPLPCVTLIRPMESEGPTQYHCLGGEGCFNTITHTGHPDCMNCAVSRTTTWGWLACIHAHIEGSRFGYHTAFVASVDALLADWLEDPEAALRKWFKYEGPQPRSAGRVPAAHAVGDLWGDEG